MSSRYHYGRLLRDHARKHGDMLEYSEPQLVNGGLAPPPCRGLPGTECFMVIVSVDDKDFFGFGPTALLATHYAEKDAYVSITSKESDREQLVNGLPHMDDEIDPVNINSNPPILHATNELSNLVSDTSCEADLVSTGESLCALPTETAEEKPFATNNSVIPQTPTELNTLLETPPPFVRPKRDSISLENPLKNNNVISALFNMAKRRGIFDVSFSSKEVGPKHSKLIIVRAYGGGFSFEGRHFRPHVAKCEAAAKLYETLSQLPEQVPFLPSSPLQRSLSSDNGRLVGIPITQAEPYQHIKEENVQDRGEFVQDRSLDIEAKAVKLAPIISPNQSPLISTPTSPVESESSGGNQNSNSPIFLNPVGQLNELLTKEHLEIAAYRFTCKTYGVHTEHICIVTAKDLSAAGVGICRRSSKRCAAANILYLMESKGMNIYPQLCPTKKKKAYRSSPLSSIDWASPLPQPRSPCSPQSLSFSPPYMHNRTPALRDRPSFFCPPGPRNLKPPLPLSRFTRPHLAHSSLHPSRPPHVAHSSLHPSHPFLLPRLHNAHAVPPQSAYLPLQRRRRFFSTESESDSDCGRISSGLREIIPLSCSEKNSKIAELPDALGKLSVNDGKKCVIDSTKPLDAKPKDHTITNCKTKPTAIEHQHITMPGVKILVKDSPSRSTSSCTENPNSIYSKNTPLITSEQPQSIPAVKKQAQSSPAAKEQPQGISITKKKVQNGRITSPYTRLPLSKAAPSNIIESGTSDTTDKIVSLQRRKTPNHSLVTKWHCPQRKIEPWIPPDSELWPSNASTDQDKASQDEDKAIQDEDDRVSSTVANPSHTKVGPLTQLPRHPLLASFTNKSGTTSMVNKTQPGHGGRRTGAVSLWNQSVPCL